jgi:hypothetical protein
MFAPGGWIKRLGALRLYPTISSSPLFDARWYRRRYLRGAASLVSARLHYLLVGHSRECDPSAAFDTGHYLESNPDVRKSGLNALFHFHHYGAPERRSALRSSQQTWNHLLPDSRELPTFRTPRLGEPRLTVLVDSRTLRRTDLSLEKILGRAIELAHDNGRSLRIISLLADNDDVHAALRQQSPTAQGADFSFVTSPPHEYTTSYDLHDDEIIVATSWTSAHAVRFALPHTQLWVLAPDTLIAALAERTQLGKGLVHFSEELARTWSILSDYGDQSLAPPPGPPADDASGAACHLGIVVHSPEAHLLYAWTLHELDVLLRAHPSLAERLSLTIIGEGLRPLRILETLTPQVLNRASPALMESLDSRVDISLTPVPSSGDAGAIAILPGHAVTPGAIANLLARATRHEVGAHG